MRNYVIDMNHQSADRRELDEIFGAPADSFIKCVDVITNKAQSHKYSFYTDEMFNLLKNENPPNIALLNQITAHELLEKTHLCAVSLLRRNRSWIDAIAYSYRNGNYFGFSAAARGYIESVADGVDGVSKVGLTIATHHRRIQRFLSGKMDSGVANFSDIEKVLDHYMFAGWTRERDPIRKEKGNQAYIEGINTGDTPDVLSHWRTLCSISHPSSASVSVFYEMDDETREIKFVENAEVKGCEELLTKIKPSLSGILPYATNPSLIILRVMHKFPSYPMIPEMKKIAFDQIPIWKKISKLL